MAMFVHLAPESQTRSIRRDGIVRTRMIRDGQRGIFAMPVTENFIVSHQWLRELKRRGCRTLSGVYFRIPDDEPVWIGRFDEEHRLVTAAEAVATLRNPAELLGMEVIIPRQVAAREICRIRHLPQVVGWRYRPGIRGWNCMCVSCNPPGTINSRRKREAWEARRNRRDSRALLS